MKQFDDILKENIKQAFSEYNADHLAGEGWNSFMEAKKDKRKAIFLIFPFWTRAAAIALLIGVGGLITYVTVDHRNDREQVLTEKVSSPAEEKSPSGTNLSTASVPGVTEGKTLPQGEKKSSARTRITDTAVVRGTEALNEPMSMEMTAVTLEPVGLPVMAENILPAENDSASMAEVNIVQEQPGEEPLQNISGEKGKRSLTTTFMAGLSGLMSHVNDAGSASPGVSVGFYLDQKISRRISFRPGLALAMNSLGFSNTQSSPAVASSLYYADGINGTPESFDGQLSTVTMEVPLNLVFKVFERKSKSVFLSAGASTMIYLGQHFTGDAVNENTRELYNEFTGMSYTEKRYSTVSVENSYSPFSRTDYFGLANFSAGYSIPFGKGTTLLIEPFVQLPLSGLTSLDLNVRFAGISMKINLGGKDQ